MNRDIACNVSTRYCSKWLMLAPAGGIIRDAKKSPCYFKKEQI
jgi:hypothetical protein